MIDFVVDLGEGTQKLLDAETALLEVAHSPHGDNSCLLLGCVQCTIQVLGTFPTLAHLIVTTTSPLQ